VGAASGRRVGLVAGLTAAAFFATSGPVVKPLLAAGWTPGAAILVRLTIGTALLAGPALWSLRGRFQVVRDEWRMLLAFGTVAVAGASSLYYLAVDRLPVAVALLVEYSAPLLLLALSWVRTRRTPPRAVLAGAGLAMGGLVLVLDLTGSLDLDPLGLAFALAAAVGNAAYFLLAARPTRMPPLGLAGVGMAVGASVVGLLVIAGVLPWAAPAVHVDVLGAHVPWWVLVVVLGIVPTGLAYAVSATSVRLLGERVASFVALAEVLFAVLLAWALLGEAPLPVQVFGAALVVAGVALVRAGARPVVVPEEIPDVVPDEVAEQLVASAR
jgi:drug/metabolite transporter (DMT)-like permease